MENGTFAQRSKRSIFHYIFKCFVFQKHQTGLLWSKRLRLNFALFHSVLNKVSKYRGMNRDKNELNAAFWFTQPGM